MHYYQFNVGDYRKDTTHLKPIQHYIYRTLIDGYFMSEKPIKNDIPEVTRKLGLDNDRSTDVQQVLNDFFVLMDGCYHHPRIEADIEEYRKQIAAASSAGKASAAARKAKKDAVRERALNGGSTSVQPTKNQEPETNNQIKAIAISKTDCPHTDILALYHKLLPSCPSIRDWTPARQSNLRARWNEDTSRQNLDYWESLFKYIADIPFLTGQISSSGRKPFFASLDWIVKAENFAKIREGRYD